MTTGATFSPCRCQHANAMLCWDLAHPILSSDPEEQYLIRERRGIQELACDCPCHGRAK